MEWLEMNNTLSSICYNIYFTNLKNYSYLFSLIHYSFIHFIYIQVIQIQV
jgi:hypothetical protein